MKRALKMALVAMLACSAGLIGWAAPSSANTTDSISCTTTVGPLGVDVTCTYTAIGHTGVNLRVCTEFTPNPNLYPGGGIGCTQDHNPGNSVTVTNHNACICIYWYRWQSGTDWTKGWTDDGAHPSTTPPVGAWRSLVV